MKLNSPLFAVVDAEDRIVFECALYATREEAESRKCIYERDWPTLGPLRVVPVRIVPVDPAPQPSDGIYFGSDDDGILIVEQANGEVRNRITLNDKRLTVLKELIGNRDPAPQPAVRRFKSHSQGVWTWNGCHGTWGHGVSTITLDEAEVYCRIGHWHELSPTGERVETGEIGGGNG